MEVKELTTSVANLVQDPFFVSVPIGLGHSLPGGYNGIYYGIGCVVSDCLPTAGSLPTSPKHYPQRLRARSHLSD